MASASQLEQRIAALEARLADAEAVIEIQALKARYGELVDRRYGERGPRERPELERIADQIVALFSADAVWDGGRALGTHRGRDAIRERFLDPTLRFTWHYFVKPRIEVRGDAASGRWDILAPVAFGDGEPGWMAGVEDDEYVRVDGRWLHSRMKLELVFMAPGDRGWRRGGR